MEEEGVVRDPALSMFPAESQLASGAAQDAQEAQALEEQEEEKRLEEEIAKKLQGAFDDIDFDLEEEESFLEEGHAPNTPHQGGPGSSRIPEHFLTSTPYVRGGLEGGALTDTPTRHWEERNDTPTNERRTPVAHDDQLEVLYLARGHEIDRLKAEIDSLRNENGGENRRLKHELALTKADNERLTVQVEQGQHVYDGTAEDNRQLRSEVEHLKSTLQKQEKAKAELMDRAESSDHMVQTLQQQLIDLQRKDTVLKAREHHDSIVRSLKDRHESEVFSLQQEVDRLNAQMKRYESEMDILRGKMNETQRLHESMLVEKAERIEDLSQKLAETQKRLTQVIVANSTQDMESRIGDPLKEIIELKTKVGSMAQQRNEQDKHIHDLMDEICGLQEQLKDTRGKAQSSVQDQMYELRMESNAKDQLVEELRRRERDLIQQCEKLKADMLLVRQKMMEVDRESLKTREALDHHNLRDLELLKDEIHRKDNLLEVQEERIKSLVSNWEIEIQKIRANHGKERRESEGEVMKKYINLKKKVVQYQRHVKGKETHYQEEIERLRDTFKHVLLGYKSKLDGAYQSREKMIEDELRSLKDNFDSELHRLAQDDVIESGPLSLESQYRGQSRLPNSSDEENHRPRGSNSEQLAQLFAKATKDARNQLKKPSERIPLFQQN